jgi:hypothetical protein
MRHGRNVGSKITGRALDQPSLGAGLHIAGQEYRGVVELDAEND